MNCICCDQLFAYITHIHMLQLSFTPVIFVTHVTIANVKNTSQTHLCHRGKTHIHILQLSFLPIVFDANVTKPMLRMPVRHNCAIEVSNSWYIYLVVTFMMQNSLCYVCNTPVMCYICNRGVMNVTSLFCYICNSHSYLLLFAQHCYLCNKRQHPECQCKELWQRGK